MRRVIDETTHGPEHATDLYYTTAAVVSSTSRAAAGESRFCSVHCTRHSLTQVMVNFIGLDGKNKEFLKSKPFSILDSKTFLDFKYNLIARFS